MSAVDELFFINNSSSLGAALSTVNYLREKSGEVKLTPRSHVKLINLRIFFMTQNVRLMKKTTVLGCSRGQTSFFFHL